MRTESELRGLTGIKWSRHPDDVLAAWVADMDLAPPDFAVQAVRDLAERGDFGYNLTAVEQLPAVFSEWQRRYHGWQPDVEEITIFNDVLHAIAHSIWLHTKPGDGIVLLTPIYPPFIKAVEGSGRRVVDVKLDTEGWRLDPERLEAAIDETTTAVLLCNPHNPTGRVLDQIEREAIAKVVVENDLLLISDEVWGDLTHPGNPHVPMATVNDEVAERLITISSPSKAFNLAGLRFALAHIGSPRLAKQFDGLPPHFLGAVGSPGSEAALRCWTEGHDWLAETKTFLTARRDQLAARVAADLPGVVFQVPEATYLAWLDFSALELDAEPRDWLFEHAKVALSPGPDFGQHGAGYVRINTATSPQLLDEVLDRIVGAVNSR
ncbi:MAG: MalY/PatB family protein [Acidimicrobiales bacterium]